MGVPQSAEDQQDLQLADQQQVFEILRQQGIRLLHPFDHPTFGRLVLGMLERKGVAAKHVYVREFTVQQEERGLILYQYLLRQEQLENSSFLRVYSHLLKPLNVHYFQ